MCFEHFKFQKMNSIDLTDEPLDFMKYSQIGDLEKEIDSITKEEISSEEDEKETDLEISCIVCLKKRKVIKFINFLLSLI